MSRRRYRTQTTVRRRVALIGVAAILFQAFLFGWHHYALGPPAAPIAGILATPLLLGVSALAQNPVAADQPAPSVSLSLDVVAKQLDIARNQIQPRLGASTYEFRREAIESQPQGDNAP